MGTPLDRVTEFVRQFEKLRDTGGKIHSVQTDPDAEGADLLLADIKYMLEIVWQYEDML